MKNYTLIEEKYSSELESKICIYRHNKTKARICTIKNNDKNKVFAIAFRTPPIDNSGLTHILEHSVLCGSEKYPVKDPFVAMIKSSVNTFLNAFTYPDKTVYPIASPNMKDFRNLMGIYMDAVLRPNIYKNENIFLQEGWHYHILDEKDPIIYNGVVYNEMKGVFSNPDGVLERHVLHSLYPNNAYSLESGGDPKYIPTLSYESFKNFHKKYYSPSNSYIYLYGDLDHEAEMEWLDNEYLSKFDFVDFDTRIKDQPVFKAEVSETHYYEAQGDDSSFLTYNIMIPKKFDYKLYLALDLILDTLFNLPGAPLKNKIQELGIALNVEASISIEFMNPFISILASGAKPEMETEFKKIINEYFESLVKNGIPKDTILSLINHTEFNKREHMYTVNNPKGIDVILSSLNSWLYDDNHPYDIVEFVDKYLELKKDIDNHYFEDIIQEYILDNKHKSYIKLLPKEGYLNDSIKELEKELADYKNSLSNDELKDLIEKNKKLIEYQNSTNTEEELNTLPKLSLDDLDKEPSKYCVKEIDNKYKTLYFEGHTNGISYIDLLFDISDINPNQLIIIDLYLLLIKRLSTKKYSENEIVQYILNNLGGISYNTLKDYTKEGECKLYIVLSISAVNNNIEKGLDLLHELLFNTILDTDKIYKLLGEDKTDFEKSILNKGHRVSLNRALSKVSLLSLYDDALSGIEYLDFIEGIYKNYGNEKQYLKEELSKVINYLTKENVIISITSEKESLNNNISLTNKFVDKLNDHISYEKYKFIEKPESEAIIIPAKINFLATGYDKITDDSVSILLKSIISMDYLWQEIRVLGGAYGAFMAVNKKNIGLTSYRDPNLDKTYNTYRDLSKFIKDLSISESDLLDFKISTLGQFNDELEHIKTKSKTAIRRYLYHLDYEYRKENMNRIIDVKLNELNNFSYIFDEINKKSSTCALCNENDLKDSKIKFDVIRKLVD